MHICFQEVVQNLCNRTGNLWKIHEEELVKAGNHFEQNVYYFMEMDGIGQFEHLVH